MASRVLTLELPEDVAALLGSPDEVGAQVKELLVVELLRRGRIGQSRAAEVLGTTRWEILELMDRYAIPQGPETAEQLERDAASRKDRLSRIRRRFSGSARLQLQPTSPLCDESGSLIYCHKVVGKSS